MAIQPSEPALPTRDRDVRAARPYVFLRTPLRTFGRRVLGVTSLALLDIVGLSLGIYLALVLRSVVFGDTVLWSLLWRTESEEWLPFLIPITLLVFWQAGLYATRERRAGIGRVASSLLLVALIVLAFGYGTGYDFNTTGLIPTALVVCAITMGLLRAAYDSFTLEVERLLHARKRALLLGSGQSLATLRRMLSGKRAGIAYEFVDVLPPDRDKELSERIALARPDEVILNEGDFEEAAVLEIVRPRIARP
jgi:FlaA1/EpsC-like NDP-sugar epimerase